MKDSKLPKRKPTSKQIVALIGVILLVTLYIVTLFVAIFAPAESNRLFQACLGASILVPILIWIYVWLYGKLTNKHTIADSDFLKSSEDTE